MIISLATYKSYFKWFADNHVDLNSFQMGGVEQILSRERTDMVYPCMWLEYPEVTHNLREGRISFRGAVVVMATLEPLDVAEETTLTAMEGILIDILSKIKEDWENRVCNIEPDSIPSDVILAAFSDGDYGWRIEFQATTAFAYCYNPAKFGIE